MEKTLTISTGTSGNDTVVIETNKERIELTVTEARRLATIIAFVATLSKKGLRYEEAFNAV